MPVHDRRATSSQLVKRGAATRPPRTAPCYFQNISPGRRHISGLTRSAQRARPPRPRARCPWCQPQPRPLAPLPSGAPSGANTASHRAAAAGSNSAAEPRGNEGLPAPFPETERGRRAGECREAAPPLRGGERPGEAKRGEARRRAAATAAAARRGDAGPARDPRPQLPGRFVTPPHLCDARPSPGPAPLVELELPGRVEAARSARREGAAHLPPARFKLPVQFLLSRYRAPACRREYTSIPISVLCWVYESHRVAVGPATSPLTGVSLCLTAPA